METDNAKRVWSANDQQQRNNPYPAYRELLRQAPVHRAVDDYGRESWYVLGYQEARQALTDIRIVRDASKVPGKVDPLASMGLHRSMLGVDPPAHTRLRRLVVSAFTPARIDALRPRIAELAEGLLDQLPDRGSFDLIDSFAFPLPVRVIGELLGIPTEQQSPFRGWVRDLFAPRSDHETTAAAGAALASYLTGLIEAKRADPGPDLVSNLIGARDGDRRLDDAELLSTVTLLLVAGHETTVNLIASAALALLDNPGELSRLRTDPTLIPQAVEELLRYDGPTELAVARWATTDVELGGVHIPAGAQIMVVLAAANRDQDQIAEPDRLELDRRPNHHLAFGHGVHYCLGAPLARVETEIALRALLSRFPRLELAVPRDEVRVQPNLSLRAYPSVPLTSR